MKPIREQIRELLNVIWQNADMQPLEASEKLIKLSALLGNVGDNLVKLERSYAQKKISYMQDNPKWPMSKVEIFAQDTDEYQDLRETKELQKSVVEACRALKVFIRVREEEYQNSR